MTHLFGTPPPMTPMAGEFLPLPLGMTNSPESVSELCDESSITEDEHTVDAGGAGAGGGGRHSGQLELSWVTMG